MVLLARRLADLFARQSRARRGRAARRRHRRLRRRLRGTPGLAALGRVRHRVDRGSGDRSPLRSRRDTRHSRRRGGAQAAFSHGDSVRPLSPPAPSEAHGADVRGRGAELEPRRGARARAARAARAGLRVGRQRRRRGARCASLRGALRARAAATLEAAAVDGRRSRRRDRLHVDVVRPRAATACTTRGRALPDEAPSGVSVAARRATRRAAGTLSPCRPSCRSSGPRRALLSIRSESSSCASSRRSSP